MKHLFFDFETMGQGVYECAMIDVSVFVADTEKMLSDRPYTTSTIRGVRRFKLSVKEQVSKYGWVVSKDTVQFWESLPDKAKKNIKPLASDLTVEEFVDMFINYLIDQGKVDYWWSRSNAVDPILLWRLFESQNKYHHINQYLPHWKVRDIRTFIDSKLDFPKKNGFVPIEDETHWNETFVEHDSSWDVLADVLRIQAILRAENDLKMIER